MSNKSGKISLIGLIILIVLIMVVFLTNNNQEPDILNTEPTENFVETEPIIESTDIEQTEPTENTQTTETTQATEVLENTKPTEVVETPAESIPVQDESENVEETLPPTEPPIETTTPPTEEKKPVVSQVSNGKSITLDTRYLTVDPAKFITAPTEADFGIYYNHAVTLYNAILLNAERLTIIFDIEGTSDSLSHITPELEAAMVQAREDWEQFSNTFNNKVLNGYVCIQTEAESFYSATFVVLPALVYSELSGRKTDAHVYYEANIEAGLYDGMSEKEAVTKINSYICKKLNYAIDVANPITALKLGKGNCAAYSILFEGMCDNANIACDVVSGWATSNSNSGAHGWNHVKVGDTWYYIDVCWNDTTGNAYFLSEELWSNHTID